MSETTNIRRHVLCDGDVSVAILNLGAITQSWQVPLDGVPVPVVLGYDVPQDYASNPCFLGVIAGRVANRVSGASCVIDGHRYHLTANEPPNQLHGGDGGIHSQIWDMEPAGARAVHLRLVSSDGDQGYPGRVQFEVTISLSDFTLSYDMRATTNTPTLVNLAQHSYYNLMGAGDIFDHHLQVDADALTPTDAAMIPTGQISPLAGQSFDLRHSKSLRAADPAGAGLDMNFVLNGGADQPAATLRAPNGLHLSLTTDQPCLQLYTGTHLHLAGGAHAGQDHAAFSGVCLEPQGYPNAVNTRAFPSVLITPDHPYQQKLSVRIAPVGAP